ncbi:MAG: bifunctional adenosylcobinamide kinase/adenosylcobinamide-phosphate guanylyltransferase [Armatimonadota bacterium]
MAKIILVTGGSRSGKSSYSQKLAEGIDGSRVFIATCPIIDEEMAERIRKHRDARNEADWDTIEEPINLAGALRDASRYNVILVDCLTLWINNLMYESDCRDGAVTEEEIIRACVDVLDACSESQGTVIFVTSEVGMGIVPGDALSRRYRDLVGTCSQTLATGADEVILVACGIPLNLK